MLDVIPKAEQSYIWNGLKHSWVQTRVLLLKYKYYLFPNPAGHPTWGSYPAGTYLNPFFFALFFRYLFFGMVAIL